MDKNGTPPAGKYIIPVMAKALDVLDCFNSRDEPLTLAEVVSRTGVANTTAFRILQTFVSRGYLRQAGAVYRLDRMRRRPVVGFANCSRQISLAVDIQRSVEQAALNMGIDLLVRDNDRNADKAVAIAHELAEQHVDVAIEFQLYEQVAPVIADIFQRANIPLIALVNPIYGTRYFGCDNYRAGLTAGAALARYAKRRWGKAPDSVILLESPRAGRMVQSRLVGAVEGLKAEMRSFHTSCVEYLDGCGEEEASSEVIHSLLRRRSARRRLVIAINDESALGADAGARVADPDEVAIVGFGGSQAMLERILDHKDSRCAGTVSFHAERYGAALLDYARPTGQNRTASPTCYVPHEYLDRERLRLRPLHEPRADPPRPADSKGKIARRKEMAQR